MTIYFYPSLLSGTFYFDWKSIDGFDTRVMNTLQFVEWLEFCQGIHHEEPQPGTKLARYISGMNGARGTVYQKSFEIDQVGTARSCMEWTEALRMTGWNGTMHTGSARIDDLGKFMWDDPDSLAGRIEKLVSIRPAEDVSIVLPCEMELLQPKVQELLKSIGGCHIEVLQHAAPSSGSNLEKFRQLVEGNMDVEFNEKDDTLEVWNFKDTVDAMNYISAFSAEEFDVWINGDNTVLDEWLKLRGKAQSGSVARGVLPLKQQLFPLGLRLFTHPTDVDNLLGYLSVKDHPLKGIAFLLKKRLLANGGVYEWKEAVDEYLENHPDCEIQLETCCELLPVYDFFSGRFVNPEMSVDSVRRFCSIMRDCCAGFAELDAILEVWKGEITAVELDELVMSLMKGADIQQSTAQVGAHTVITSPGAIVGHPEKTLWVNFFSYDTHVLSTAFLTVGERKSLQDVGCALWDAECESRYLAAMDNLPLALTSGKLVLVTCDRKARGDEATNPLQIRLSSCSGYKENLVIRPDMGKLIEDGVQTVEAIEVDNVKSPDVSACLTFQPPYTEEGSEDYEKFKALLTRKTESPSSIESLIQNPFEYYMHYVLGFQNEESDHLPERYLVKGNVAHLVLQELFFTKRVTSKESLEAGFEESYRDAVLKKGMLLLRADNAMMALAFHDRLKESAAKLLEIIHAMDLEVEAVEYHCTDNHTVLGDDVEISGYIDMLLHEAGKESNKVILDFKWTNKPETYKGKIKEGKSIQLSLYRKMISTEEGSRVMGAAYFLMPDNELRTNDDYFARYGESSIVPVCDEEICDKIRNSVNFRKEQFLSGRIELGEYKKKGTVYGPDAETLEYFQNTDSMNLLPLDLKGEKTVRKAPYGFTGYGSFKFD